MSCDILIAHPYKHHVFNLAAGCIHSGKKVILAVPLYNKGLGSLISSWPGQIGKKATGYYHPDISPCQVYSPFIFQFKKLLGIYKKDIYHIAGVFDQHIAEKILSGFFNPQLIVVMQNYMPLTIQAAKKKGIKVWVDVICYNFSMEHVFSHYNTLGIKYPEYSKDNTMEQILPIVDYISFPSRSEEEVIRGLSNKNAKFVVAPYGVSNQFSCSTNIKSTKDLIIVARANSITKGGHLLILALEKYGDKLLDISGADSIRVNFFGEFSSELHDIYVKANFSNGIVIQHRNYAHAEVPKLLSEADLFVMPTLFESMSMACIEAMMMGLPLVVTKYTGLDVFRDGEMGVLVEDTIESVGEGLMRALREKEKWQEWGEACKTEAVQLTWQSYEEKIEAFTMSIID